MTASGGSTHGGGWVPGIEGRDSAPGQTLDNYVLEQSPKCVSDWVIACRHQNKDIKRGDPSPATFRLEQPPSPACGAHKNLGRRPTSQHMDLLSTKNTVWMLIKNTAQYFNI